MSGKYPKNANAVANLWSRTRTTRHRDTDKPARTTYVYDPKNNVNTRKICKQCAYREGFGNGYEYICACFLRTGVMRDLHPTNEHCETFKKRR